MKDKIAIPLSDEAANLLKEARFDSHGRIWYQHHSGDVLRISTNGKRIVDSDENHLHAAWESAMQELEENEFIEPAGHGRKCFVVTKKGYELACD